MSVEYETYQQQLARTLQTSAPSLSEQVIQAFQAIPRHRFVDHYYLHQHKEGTPVWTRYERDESAAWYEQVYGDRSLVTRVDQYGRTLSSSSQPAVMASMLDALDIRPGLRVLVVSGIVLDDQPSRSMLLKWMRTASVFLFRLPLVIGCGPLECSYMDDCTMNVEKHVAFCTINRRAHGKLAPNKTRTCSTSAAVLANQAVFDQVAGNNVCHDYVL